MVINPCFSSHQIVLGNFDVVFLFLARMDFKESCNDCFLLDARQDTYGECRRPYFPLSPILSKFS